MMSIRRLSKTLLKPVVIILILGLCIGLFYAIPRFNTVDSSYLYKGPAARVNGQTIKDEDFNEIYVRYLRQAGGYLSEEEMKVQTMEYLIESELVRQAVKEQKVEISAAEIDKFLEDVKTYNQIKSDEELKMLISQVGAKNLKAFKEMLREILAEQKLYAQLAKEAKLEVSEEEVKEHFETMDLSHILIATDSLVTEKPSSPEAALKKAQEVYRKLQAGEKFEDLAKEYSDDASNKEQGGLLGTASVAYFKSVFVPEFVDAALKLKAGEYSAPVKTEFGYHLIKMNERKYAQGEEWEAAKERIRTELYAQKFQMEKRQEWIKNLRENEAKIEILDPMLLGYSLAEKEKWAEAAQAYEKALTDKRYKNKLNTFLALANVYKEAKNFDAALNVFNRLPKEFANDFAVPMVKAEIYAAQEKKEEAKQALLEAQAKAGDELMLLRQVLEKMQELGLTAETEALQEKIEALEAKFQAEQEELTRIILEEQERINSQQSEIFETPSAEK